MFLTPGIGTKMKIAETVLGLGVGDGGTKVAIIHTQPGSIALSKRMTANISLINMVEAEGTAIIVGLRQSTCFCPSNHLSGSPATHLLPKPSEVGNLLVPSEYLSTCLNPLSILVPGSTSGCTHLNI